MCGIAGWINLPLSNESAGEAMTQMLSALSHRGPDEAGYLMDKGNAIGNVRLSIVDLQGGIQPIGDETGCYWIVYNGEVFNYPELRAQLVKRGVSFSSQTDTEVVLKHLLYWGMDGIAQLNGQFALALYDKLEGSLILARDRMGIRPLYYTIVSGGLAFASEIKALGSLPMTTLRLSPEATQKIFRYWTVWPGESPFKGVHQLRPGAYLKFQNGKLTHHCYWTQPHEKASNRFSGTIQEAGEVLDALLSDAVRIRLRADVPVGAYLSGGLDSSIVAWYLKKWLPRGLNTFSIGFGNPEFDEHPYQQCMQRFMESEHREVQFLDSDLNALYEKAIWHAETPLLRTGPLPMLKLSELVHASGMKVVLTGEGADELFGGYNIFKEALIRNFWAKNPKSQMRPLLLSRLYPYLPVFQLGNGAALKMFYGYRLEEVTHPAYSHLLRWKNGENIGAFFLPEVSSGQSRSWEGQYTERMRHEFGGDTLLQRAQWIESDLFLSGYLLSSQGDRMAMAHSVEGRYPFLDYRVAEFAGSLPDEYKIRFLEEKRLLKHLFRDRLPKAILERPKQAYRAPSLALFGPQSALRDRYLSSEALSSLGWFDSAKVNRLLHKADHQPKWVGEMDLMALNGILSTQVCHQLFCQNATAIRPFEWSGSRIKRIVL